MSLDRVYQKNEDMVFRKIGDEVILVPVTRDVGDLSHIYTLNPVAARIWELVDGKRRTGDIRDEIINEFEVDPSQAEIDLAEYLRQLEELKAVSLVSP